MSGSPIELADVIRRHGPEFLACHGASLSAQQRRVLRELAACRTAALGGHVIGCADCGHRQIAYNSCRNRHCPKCQATQQAQWTAAREAELLPVPYFHVVFTLPSELGPLALQNKRVVYGLLLRAAAETLRQVAADPKYLGAEIGCLAVLHTWGQNLMHHPHVHCIVPAGGLSPDGTHWVHCRRSKKTGKLFFLPVRVLSRVFRGKFIRQLKQAFARRELSFHGSLRASADPAEFEGLLDRSVRQDWVVYAKRPFGGPHQVLKYLARYTHRVAISNRRLLALDEGRVQFRWKDYAEGGAQKVMSLDAAEFLRRFLMHTLPSGFVRIRYYGLLAHRFRDEKLARCRSHLQDESTDRSESDSTGMTIAPAGDGLASHTDRCPICDSTRLILIETFQPESGAAMRPRRPFFFARFAVRSNPDSS